MVHTWSFMTDTCSYTIWILCQDNCSVTVTPRTERGVVHLIRNGSSKWTVLLCSEGIRFFVLMCCLFRKHHTMMSSRCSSIFTLTWVGPSLVTGRTTSKSSAYWMVVDSSPTRRERRAGQGQSFGERLKNLVATSTTCSGSLFGKFLRKYNTIGMRPKYLRLFPWEGNGRLCQKLL